MRKWKIVEIRFTPFQFNPKSGDLRHIHSVSVQVDYQRLGIGALAAGGSTDDTMEERASQMLFNYGEAQGLVRHFAGHSKAVGRV